MKTALTRLSRFLPLVVLAWGLGGCAGEASDTADGEIGLTASAAGGLTHFASPTRNIGCIMTTSGVRCDIGRRDWTPPPKPPSCDLDSGQGLRIGVRGKGGFVRCAGDTVMPFGKEGEPGATPELPYGRSKTVGRFRCTSRESGMRCVNRRNGHGFVLSIQRARRF